MYKFDSIIEAKKLTKSRDNNRYEQAKEIYKEALKFIRAYKKTNNREDLVEASNKLFESVRLHRGMVEPYVWLAYIFHSLGKDDMAFKYLKIAETFDPEFPQIAKLKDLIQENTDLNQPEEEEKQTKSEKYIARKTAQAEFKGKRYSAEEEGIMELIQFSSPIKMLATAFASKINFFSKDKPDKF